MLDKTRNYGLVYGDPKVRYEQDGILFDPAGRPLITKTENVISMNQSERMKQYWQKKKSV